MKLKFLVLIRSPKAEKKIYKYNFKKAKALALKAKEKYADRPDVKVYLISCTKAIPPKPQWRRSTFKHLWCPYCAAERRFKDNKQWGTKQCPVCGITTADYWVKTYNHMWPSKEQLEKARRKNG